MHLLWNSCDDVFVVVMCQYDNCLKFHFLGHFCGLMCNVFAFVYQGCVFVSMFCCFYIVHTSVAELNGEVKTAVSHGGGMRCEKQVLSKFLYFFPPICVCACALSQGPVLVAVMRLCVFYGHCAALQCSH